MLLLGKIMILQGVRHPISCLGVCYANDPKKGGYMTPAPALDLTTSLRGDFLNFLHGGPTTNGPHPPSYLSKLAGGGGGGLAGGGGGGYWQLGRGGGAGPEPLLPHAYLKGGCVSGGMGV